MNQRCTTIVGALLATGLVATPRWVRAQQLPLKHPTLTAVTVACPAQVSPSELTVATQHDQANRLASLGEQAALEGNHTAARDLYVQASQLDPREPSIAYRLGREDEETADTAAAVREYCRYLALAHDSPDTAQGTTRIRALLPTATLDRAQQVTRAFAFGIERYDARDWNEATRAFGTALAGDTLLAAAAYDRALARLQQGQKVGAMHDFDRYLALDPTADDATVVQSEVATLRNSFPKVGTAVVLGIIPGGGQFYTHQPILGAVILAAAGAGVVLAIQSKTVTILVDSTFQGPFGTTYTQQVPVERTQHPNTAIGLGIAGAATVVGMIEAAIVAHSRSSGLDTPEPAGGLSVSPLVAPAPGGRLAVGLSIRP